MIVRLLLVSLVTGWGTGCRSLGGFDEVQQAPACREWMVDTARLEQPGQACPRADQSMEITEAARRVVLVCRCSP